jgi:NitT/TauT family transport system substrate-binding protein
MAARAFVLAIPFAIVVSPAAAEDVFKVVIGNAINWENQALQLGQEVGIYKKHGIVLDTVTTSGAGETIQPIIAGSADMGGPIAMVGAYRVFERGAPIRILMPMFTGDNTYWYVKASSPIKSLKDASAKYTIAYSSSGSTTDLIVQGFAKEFGVKAVPTKAGGMVSTLTQVMSGQVDIGWAAPPFGLEEVHDGKIRIIARGNDLASLRSQTVRVLIINDNVLKTRREAVLRFAKAYREAVDWMYADPKAMEMYAKLVKRPLAMIHEAVEKFQPKSALQYDKVSDIEGSMRDAVNLKFIDKPLTKEQLDRLIQIPPRH